MTPRLFRAFSKAERDVDEELAFHFESRIEDLMRGGFTGADARRTAEAEFGDVGRVRAELTSSTRRRAARRSWREAAGDLRDDSVYIARAMRRSPAFALIVAVTLGLGIGAASTVYGVVDRLLLRGPAHLLAPASLRRVYAHVKTKSSGEFTTSSLPYAAYVALRDHSRTIAAAAAYAVNEARVGAGVDAVPVQLGMATADFFPLLGVKPLRGRFFSTAESGPPDGQRVAVVSYGYWVRALGASDDAIGRTITMAEKPYTIIGIAPNGFTGAELRPADVWIPVSAGFHPTPDWPATWRAQWLNVVVRLKPGFSAHQIDDDVTRVFRTSYGGTDRFWAQADVSARDIAFTSAGRPRDDATIARWLAAVALLVLLIAAANTANLLIVRAMRREHETAVRLALGISRGRLMRLFIIESAGYALLGCVVGIGLAYGGGQMMRRVLLPAIAWDAGPVNARVLAFSLVVMIAVALIVGAAVLPHVLATRMGASLQRTGGNRGPRGSRTRQSLLIAQMAMSVTLLVGAGLFLRSLSNVRRLDLGLQPDRVLVASVGWPRFATPGTPRDEHERITNRWRELADRISRYPGVDHAALAIGSPFGNGFGVDVRVPGRDTLPTAPGGGPYISAVSADYFNTTATRLVRGRGFMSTEGENSPRVAIVNETMASLLWPGEDAIGKCIIVNNTPCATVVGITRDARRNAIQEPPSMQYYVPYGQESGIGGTVLLVRPSGDARGFTQTLRRAILSATQGANYLNVSSMQDRVDSQVRPWRLGATMFSLFGLLALIVAAVGLYSVIAYSTAQRTHEFGVKLAIGASAVRLTGTVLAEGVRVALIGVVAGGVGALLAGGRIEPLLFHVSPTDPVVLLSVAGVLVVVALFASLAPALRAARVDPVEALRSV